MSLSIP